MSIIATRASDTERALYGTLRHDTFMALRGTAKHGLGRLFSATQRLCIANLPKRLKMFSLSRNSSIWQPSARRSPITSRIDRQADNDARYTAPEGKTLINF
jgi:hypothetical protein